MLQRHRSEPDLTPTSSLPPLQQEFFPRHSSSSSSSVYDTNTTVMVRDIPSELCQEDLVQDFIDLGFRGLFDFVYIPMNLRGCGNFGYAFINFIDNATALRVMNQGHNDKCLRSSSWTCMWSSCQGLDSNVERYRNSPLMHKSVPAGSKPTKFDHTGQPVSFPRPTVKISKPRIHSQQPKG